MMPPSFRPFSLKALTKPSVVGPDGRKANTPSAPESLMRCMIGEKSLVASGMRIASTT
ncbi:hypothetical protein D9M70_590190 [compost metagenome]